MTSHAAIREQIATDPAAGLIAAEQMAARDPADARARRLMARALRGLGREGEAQVADLAAIDASVHDPELQAAAIALAANRLAEAEPILKARLRADPFDVAAMRMLAELAGRIGRNGDAEALLTRALELAPAWVGARTNLATVLHRQNKTAEALAEIDRLSVEEPDNPGHANLRAAVLGRTGEFAEAIALYEDVLARAPHQPKIWMSYGHALKTVGRQADAVAAYRRAAELRPAFGEAWWSLANLKTTKLTREDIAAMAAARASGEASTDDLFHLDFALAKAHDDAGEPEAAFAHYARANAGRRAVLPWDADHLSRAVDALIAQQDAAFFAARAGVGDPAPDPIFILGLPRAGSTLIEQILASHSMIEGTMELPDIPTLVADLGRERNWPGLLADLPRERFAELGGAYLERTRGQRREGKPLFIDKLPNNWLHTGFIHLILPNARIIDARRHPLDCGWSNFRQHFARGQAFSYDLADIGQYYADYVRLMRHYDSALPGRVVRVVHEHLLDDPEGETRRLLAALSLPFEGACLRFHENSRAVRTASSEQVRRPINRDGADQWRAVEPHLGPLIGKLGDLIAGYAT